MWFTESLTPEYAMTEITTFKELSNETVTTHRSLWGDVWRQFRNIKVP
ncbi:MAG: hypothetical protein CM1200mP30_27340 [Pseudomonadota bacterium]|nr:MAG: hypothetical protein CM1200mP30_27340 [Pseudomonadota bacterium]